ncbi:hypothetical protein ACVII0_004186 [Sinorhizobium meliloti]
MTVRQTFSLIRPVSHRLLASLLWLLCGAPAFAQSIDTLRDTLQNEASTSAEAAPGAMRRAPARRALPKSPPQRAARHLRRAGPVSPSMRSGLPATNHSASLRRATSSSSAPALPRPISPVRSTASTPSTRRKATSPRAPTCPNRTSRTDRWKSPSFPAASRAMSMATAGRRTGASPPHSPPRGAISSISATSSRASTTTTRHGRPRRSSS